MYNKETDKVVIEDGVYLGWDATVLRGLRIGKGPIVGAGTVITKDILWHKMSDISGREWLEK